LAIATQALLVVADFAAVLADIAGNDPAAFKAIADKVRAALA